MFIFLPTAQSRCLGLHYQFKFLHRLQLDFKKIPILAEARISSLHSVWPSAGLTSPHASRHFYTSPWRQWQALLGILAMAEEVAFLGVDLLALLLSSSNVELEALHSPPPGL